MRPTQFYRVTSLDTFDLSTLDKDFDAIYALPIKQGKRAKMLHAMTDIEAIGKGTHGLIVSIGACRFDPRGGKPSERFKVNINMDNALKHGASVTGSTMRWWLSQSEEARASLFEPKPVAERVALSDLRDWYGNDNAIPIWSHGVNFDLRLLAQAYERHSQPTPWLFRSERDTRTLFDLAGEAYWLEVKTQPRAGTHHDALDDAIAQVGWVQAAYRCLNAT